MVTEQRYGALSRLARAVRPAPAMDLTWRDRDNAGSSFRGQEDFRPWDVQLRASYQWSGKRSQREGAVTNDVMQDGGPAQAQPGKPRLRPAMIIGGQPGQATECRVDDPDRVLRAGSKPRPAGDSCQLSYGPPAPGTA